MDLTKSFLFVATASLYFAVPTLTQSTDNSTSNTCSSEAVFTSAFNSTGTVEFRLPEQDPWHLSLGLTDMRSERNSYLNQNLDVFLSVPESLVENESEDQPTYCLYRFRGQNKPSNGKQDEQSCDDILSDKCRSAISRTSSPSDGRCSSPEIKDDCDFSVIIHSTRPANFSGPRCSDDGVDNIDLPDGYRSYYTNGGGSIGDLGQKIDSYSEYDRHVRQSIPFLVMVQFTNQSVSNVPILLCVAPDNLVAGSRVPEGKFPTNAVSGHNVKGALIIASVVSCVVMLGLAI